MISKTNKLLTINFSDFMFINEHCIVITASKLTNSHMEYQEIEFIGSKVSECLSLRRWDKYYIVFKKVTQNELGLVIGEKWRSISWWKYRVHRC